MNTPESNSELDAVTASDFIIWDHATHPPVPKLPRDSSDSLIEFILKNRDAVLKHAADRYLRCPPDGYAPPVPPGLSKASRDRVVEYAKNQADADKCIKQWLMLRTHRHSERKSRTSISDATCDLIAWQFAHKSNPIEFILQLT